MLLERRSRPVRGVRIVSRESAPFGVQVIPTRRLTVDEVRKTLDRLPEVSGPVVTSALSTVEQDAFVTCGFVERESLYLLRHRLVDVPDIVSAATIRNARRGDITDVLEIDKASFDRFWSFDRNGLSSARKATPQNRYVVAVLDRTIVGYAITGSAGTTGFLQRLAVRPGHRGQRIGSHLVSDAAAWAVRRGCASMMVNTQTSNSEAFALYKHLGFTVDSDRLKVLEWK